VGERLEVTFDERSSALRLHSRRKKSYGEECFGVYLTDYVVLVLQANVTNLCSNIFYFFFSGECLIYLWVMSSSGL
jgi:hypothetical protein